jgi:MarR family transcriptional regulator, organic hydroperoxide resistance regulator
MTDYPAAAPTFRSRSQEATVAILKTADLLRRRFARVLEPHGLTLQQYNVLRILRGARGVPMPTLDIGSRLIEQAPGITRLLDRLAEKGLVRRERAGEDRRVVLCHVTALAVDLLARIEAEVDRIDDLSLAGFDADETDAFLEMLEAVRLNLE